MSGMRIRHHGLRRRAGGSPEGTAPHGRPRAPARRVERMEPRAGFVIVPGNWQWRNSRHHWVPGRYVAERKGYNYRGDRWVQHDNRRWMMQRGGWSRDTDGDGTPDRSDARPNNPSRQ